MTGGKAASGAPLDLGEWPDDEKEWLGHCPVCGDERSSVLVDGMEDYTFRCAPGRWTLRRCEGCESGYLDPRPTETSIGRAYQNYYTHEESERRDTESMSALHRLRRSLANGYKNTRFGTDYRPALPLGTIAAHLVPGMRVLLDRQFRNLSRGKGRVLDVGFGNGEFLRQAQDMGWEAVGIDFDPVVVDNARRAGLQAYAGTPIEAPGEYDVVTLSHVIEHVHNPHATLRDCFAKLRPGGTIWIETPNVRALGLEHFGVDWRGLEPPRHLILFNRRSLRAALERAGFVDVRDIPQPNVATGLYDVSADLRAQRAPSLLAYPPPGRFLTRLIAKLREQLTVDRREFLAITAQRPD